MISMRTLGTDKVRLCQVRTSHTDMAVTSLCMAVNEIHDSQICLNTNLKAVIHSIVMTFMTHLTRVIVSEGLDRGLRLSLACQLTSDSEFQVF